MLALGEEGNLKARYDHLKKYLIKHVETCYDAWGVSQEGPGYSEYPGSFLVPAALSMKQLGDDGVKISGGKEAGRPMFLLQGRNEGYVKGWVLHPADAEVETKGDPLRINVKGGDADIWVVMLVGEGKPAEASITGTGIDSRLTVGTSTITIDNAKGRIVHGSQK